MLSDLLSKLRPTSSPVFFFFNDTATTEIYTLSLHDALPISISSAKNGLPAARSAIDSPSLLMDGSGPSSSETSAAVSESRSEEHTSELQSLRHLVCRLLLEKKKRKALWRCPRRRGEIHKR